MKNISFENVMKELDEEIVGHEQIKKELISMFMLHYEKKRMYECGLLDSYKKQMALCIGSSGTGKTFLIETLCKILGVDFIAVNATAMTAQGWKGNDLEDYLYALYEKCNKDKTRFENAVVFIDEIDKKTNYYHNTIDYEAKDQSAILKIIESDVSVIKKDNELVKLHTGGLLFVFAGAFAELTHQRENPITIVGSNKGRKKDIVITHEELIKAGMLPELVGRIGTILQFENLTRENMRDILLNTKSSRLKEWKQYFQNKGVALEISDKAINKFVDEAMSHELGARMLNTAVNNLFYQKYCELIQYPKSTLELTVNDADEFTFSYHGEPIYSFSDSKHVKVKASLYFPDGKYSYLNKRYIGKYVNDIINISFQYIHYDSKKEITGLENLLTAFMVYLCEKCPKEDFNTDSLIKLLGVSYLTGDDMFDDFIESMSKDKSEAYKKCSSCYRKAKYYMPSNNDISAIKSSIYTYANRDCNKLIRKGGRVYAGH